jgi:hypothetical protein
MNRKITVNCIMCGEQELDSEEYMRQLCKANSLWACPRCNNTANWGGISYKCPNSECGEWVSEDEEPVCKKCWTCLACEGEEMQHPTNDGRCPICGGSSGDVNDDISRMV